MAVAVTLGSLAWILRDVSPREVLHHLAQADYAWLAASTVLVTLTFPLRTVRWRILLSSSSGTVPFAPLWHATAIGFMANNVLPARAGEVVRAFSCSRLTGAPFATVLASLAVERIFDGIVVVSLLALALVGASDHGPVAIAGSNLATLAVTVAAMFTGALAALVVLVRNQARVLPWAEGVASRLLPGRAGALATRIMHNVAAGFGVLHSTRDVMRALTWSFVVWLVNAASYGLGFIAFGLEVPPTATLLLQGVVVLGVALPQAPGFFGVFELAAKAALSVYAVPGELAVSYAFGIHLGWFIPITVLGLWYLARTGLHLRELRTQRPGR